VSVGLDLPAPPPAVPAGLPSEVLRRRPDVLAAERRLAAQDRRVAAETADLYPRISLTASAGTATDELRDVVDGNFFVWSLLANITQPIFHGGRLRAEVELARARSRELLAAYSQAALRAFTEVESALSVESLLEARERHLREAAISAAAASGLSLDRYQQGIGDLVTVLEAQRRSLGADAALLEVRRLRLATRVNLHLALGGGFSWGAQREAGS
jgi:outer membrane protein TolC